MVGAGYASSVVYPWIIGCFGLDTIHPLQGGQLQADQTRACVQTRHEKERLLVGLCMAGASYSLSQAKADRIPPGLLLWGPAGVFPPHEQPLAAPFGCL